MPLRSVDPHFLPAGIELSRPGDHRSRLPPPRTPANDPDQSLLSDRVMDNDVQIAFNRLIGKQARDRSGTPLGTDARGLEPSELKGTGLCPEAQADGVPCHYLGRACELCARAALSDDD